MQLTQVSARMVTLDRSTATTAVRMAHHTVEPRKTPITSNAASAPPVPVSPRPANRPANDRIVIGFVIVSPKIEPNAATRPGRSLTTATSAGRVLIVRIARTTRNAPPTKPRSIRPPTRTDVIAVRPNAAIAA